MRGRGRRSAGSAEARVHGDPLSHFNAALQARGSRLSRRIGALNAPEVSRNHHQSRKSSTVSLRAKAKSNRKNGGKAAFRR